MPQFRIVQIAGVRAIWNDDYFVIGRVLHHFGTLDAQIFVIFTIDYLKWNFNFFELFDIRRIGTANRCNGFV